MLINLMGHSKWSWMNAYRNRYGLIRDDIHTQKKTLKKSAYWYRKLSDSNELDADYVVFCKNFRCFSQSDRKIAYDVNGVNK